MNDRFRVSRTLAHQLEEQGVSVAAVLALAGLAGSFFRQEKILVGTEGLFTLWQAIAEASGDPTIGLKLGADTRVEGGKPQTIAALASESFRDAVERMARYKRLTCPEEIRLHPAGGECAVEFAFPLAREMEPAVLVDVCLSWILAIGRRGTGAPLTPLRLELTRRAACRPALEAHYGCRVRFQAARNALVFRPGDLDRPFVTHHPELLTMLGAQFEAELKEQRRQASHPRVDEEVTAALKRLLAGRRPAIGDVARTLGVSQRTLQRRLTASGVTFQRLLREARRELARHYLVQGTLEISETAYLLGFEDANSFFRAFQRWEGTSPRRWRHAHRSAPSVVSSPTASTRPPARLPRTSYRIHEETPADVDPLSTA